MHGQLVIGAYDVANDSTIPLDGEALDRLLTIIAMRAGREVSALRVDICGEKGAILTGTARSYFAKQVAQQVVYEVTGLRVLTNRIAVVREK